MGRVEYNSAVKSIVPAREVLSISPNPFSSIARITIAAGDRDITGATLRVFDILGRMVSDLTPLLRARESGIALRAEELAPLGAGSGVYTCVLAFGRGAGIVSKSVVFVK